MNFLKYTYSSLEYRYHLLGRLRSDCEYFLGYGHRSNKYLYFDTPQEHIEAMKAIWNSLPEGKRPEWLTMEQILSYEQKMIPEKAPLSAQIQSAEEAKVPAGSSRSSHPEPSR